MAMTGLGLGYAPFASGTFGSAGACAISLAIWGLVQATGGTAFCLDASWVVLTLLASAVCVYWGPWAVEFYAGKARKDGDPGQVVIDEWAGQWVALIALPMMTTAPRMLAILAVQFFLFRLFDVIKPPPARQFEKLHAGWGILMDDIAAGIYANIIGQIIFRVIWPA